MPDQFKKKIRIINGKMFDSKGIITDQDILIEGERITHIGKHIPSTKIDETIDVQGGLISPGFIDMHVHLREPGFSDKETVRTGSYAAARGGFTTVFCMPNTKPRLSTVPVVKELMAQCEREAKVRVIPVPTLTERDDQGKEVSIQNFIEFKKLGLRFFSDDGLGVQNDEMMRKIFQEAEKSNVSVLQHCEYCHLSDGGVIHKGKAAENLSLKGISGESEWAMVKRDIELAREFDVHYHVQHISSSKSLDFIKEAKKDNLRISCEVTPHHLVLTDENIVADERNYKVNPPIRAMSDREALVLGLMDGTIDIIATDHAPHTKKEKERNFYEAPFGMVGLETAFPLLYTHLVLKGKISLQQLVALMTTKVADLFNLPWGRLEEGSVADLVTIDLTRERPVNQADFVSKGKNTVFNEWELKGWPTRTFYRGNQVYGGQ